MPSIGSLCVGSFYIFIFLPYNHSPEKSHFPALKRYQHPQFSTYRHRTGFIMKRKQVRISLCDALPLNWLVFFILILKVAYFGPKKFAVFKNFPKIYLWFFFQNPALKYTYLWTICNDNFKLTLSLKLNGVVSFIAVPPNACLFSITHFL